MSAPIDRRSRKSQATQQTILSAAKKLFAKRGFDAVTVEDIAAAADVGRVTVFNHFPHKEDIFFDCEDEGRELIRDALVSCAPGVSPIEALRLLAHRLASGRVANLQFTPTGRRFIDTIIASETLKARARAIRDDLAELAAVTMAECAGRDEPDPIMRLNANLVVAAWSAAFVEGHNMLRTTGDGPAAKRLFLSLVDRAAIGLTAEAGPGAAT